MAENYHVKTRLYNDLRLFGSAERKVWDKYNGRSNSKERSLTLLFGQQYCSYDYEPTILVLGHRQPNCDLCLFPDLTKFILSAMPPTYLLSFHPIGSL